MLNLKSSSIILLVVLIASCVPKSKSILLQDPSAPEEIRKNEFYKTLGKPTKFFTLEPGDVVGVNVASLTEEEFDFIKQYRDQLGPILKLNDYNMNAGGFGGQRGGGGGMQFGGMNQQGGAGNIFTARLNGFIIEQDGTLVLPEIGAVQVEGLTLSEATDKVQLLLEGFFETPQVRIQLLSFHFTVFGEVNNEGRFTSFKPETTLLDAISLAGNLTDFADRANIKLIRNQNTSQAEIIYIDLLDENLIASDYFYLEPDDILIVPPLSAKITRQFALPAINSTLGVVSSLISVLSLVLLFNRTK